MKLSEVCIKRPVLAWVLTFILLMLGIVGFYRLPVQKLPNIESVFMAIETQMPGVGPEIIESQITRHIEDAVAGIEGIDTVSSISSSEESRVIIEFRPGRSMDNAVNDVRDRLYRVKDKLPQPNLRTEPMIIRSKSDERPIMALALTSPSMPPSDLFDYAENEIKKDLESIAGIARVDVSGASSYVMKIEVDPQKMAGLKINVNDVREAIENQNFEAPAGSIESKDRKVNVTTVADLTTPNDFNQVIIKSEKGRIVRIKDIGKAYLNADDKKTRTQFNGNQGVQIAISKQSNANPLQVAHDVKIALTTIKKRLPKAIQLDIAADTTKFIEKSIHNVYWSIIEASVLVILVVLIFLRSARASLIPLVTIPVSIIGIAFFMYIFGFTLNIFTLFAMVLAVGLVVDDAIVVLENIHRHMDSGMEPFEASIKGIREVGFSIIAMTLTLVAVYLPIPLGSGKLAKYFTEFAITLSGSVLLSGFVALTLSPMMCARLLKHSDSNTNGSPSLLDKLPHNRYWQNFKSKIHSEEWLMQLENNYSKALSIALKKPKTVLLYSLMTAALGLWTFFTIRSEYMPQEDNRSIRIEAHAPSSATLEFTERHLMSVDKVLQEYPEIERRISTINNPTVDISLELTDESSTLWKRIVDIFLPHRRSTAEIIKELNHKFETITGFDPRITGSSSSSDSNIVTFVVRGNQDRFALQGLTEQIIQACYQTNLISKIFAGNKGDNEDYIITLNREKIANIQRSPRDIANHIRYLLKNERTGTRFKKDNKQYDITLQVFQEFKNSPEDIMKIFIRGGTYKDPALVPISELIEIESRSSPREISRYNRTRAEQISAYLRPGHTVGEAVKAIEEIAQTVLPENTQLEFIGETRRYITETQSMYLVFFLSLCFIYLILAAQFESWRDPLIIFFSVPFSLIGGVLALGQLPHGTLNMFSFIGFVTLIGLITKHGILIVDFANRLRDTTTASAKAAVLKAATLRLRPILMTTFAMVLGAVPLMFGGAGNENRQQLGAVIIGGMLIGTIVTLFVVPTVYTFITSDKRTKIKVAKKNK